MITFIGIMACVFTVLMVGAQFLKTIRSRQTRDLSTLSLIFACLEVSLWGTYAVFSEDLWLGLAAGASVIMYGVLLGLKTHNIETGEDLR